MNRVISTQKAFTLIEIAVVLLIVALLLGSILGPLSIQIDVQNFKKTQRVLEQAKEALLGYAAINGRLPCPDVTGNDGIGDWTGGICSATEGYFPWVDVGAGMKDAWGSHLRYRVDSAYTASPPCDGSTTDNLQIRDYGGTPLSNSTVLAAVIFSCGKNKIPDAENDDNLTPNTSADCSNGTPDNSVYTYDAYLDSELMYFDDVTDWLSKNVLINHLVNAGQWSATNCSP